MPKTKEEVCTPESSDWLILSRLEEILAKLEEILKVLTR